MVGAIFCDIQKAFDCVNHNILLTKLEFYGITGITYKLLKSYLKGRYQRVVLNNYSSSSCSNWGEITNVYLKDQYLVHYFFYFILMTCRK